MKLIVMSDSHGDKETVKAVSELAADAHFHCGDSELSFDDPVFGSMHKVQGNCDFDLNFPLEVVTSIQGKAVLMVHGHNHSIRSSLMGLYYEAKEKNAELVLFGHSHLYGAEMKDGILFVNPGSTRLPRGGKAPTYAVIEWGDAIKVEFRNMAHDVVDTVTLTTT